MVHEPVPGRLIADPDYLGIHRTENAVFVQITLHQGRSPEKKRALFRHIAENLETRAGVRREDVLVVLTENDSADWSFGNGEAQVLDSG